METSFEALLDRALTEPGLISQAFTTFHGYSLGNQVLALLQCLSRDITPGPIATFMGWKALGRSVRKGEKAIELCMPITCKRREQNDQANDGDAPASFTKFIYRRNWFVLSQTDGADAPVLEQAEWSASRALKALDITEAPFTMLDGNCQGYASKRAIAVSLVAREPHATRFHELAHVVLGHTAQADQRDDDRTPYSLGEVEAEAVALLCCEALGLPGTEYSRGYIQLWNARRGAEPIPARSAQKIFKAADTILRAGRESSTVELAA